MFKDLRGKILSVFGPFHQTKSSRSKGKQTNISDKMPEIVSSSIVLVFFHHLDEKGNLCCMIFCNVQLKAVAWQRVNKTGVEMISSLQTLEQNSVFEWLPVYICPHLD